MEGSERVETRTAEDAPLPGGDFRLFVQRLGYQALIGLGVLDNPLTGKHTRNLEGARGVLEDLRMLYDKTQGNLEREEEEHLVTVIRQVEKHLDALGA